MTATKSTTRLRFALDLGTESIGWAVLAIADSGASPRAEALLAAGVRIYDHCRDDKTEVPLGEQRRGPRAARRRRDRFLTRRRRLITLLQGLGLLPNDRRAWEALVNDTANDPYLLRAAALDSALTAYQIGRVIAHLNQRRGFKSNRKADGSDDKEQGKITSANLRLEEDMHGANVRTFGAFLWQRHRGTDGRAAPRARQAVRIRLEGEGKDALYDFYPTRQMLADEFDAILSKQKPYHPELLTDARIALIRNEIFFQRELKTPKRGLCTFIDGETRLDKTLPSVEARIIYEATNQVRYGTGVMADTKLTADQRDAIAAVLLQGRNVTPTQLRKTTGASADSVFRLAGGGERGLADYASKTAKSLAHQDAFGPAWHALPLPRKDEIVTKLISDDDDETVSAWLMASCGLPENNARKVASLAFPKGIASLGHTANTAVLAALMADDVPTYAEAVKRAGEARAETWHHSDIDNPERREFLPYYAQVLQRQVMPASDAPGEDKLEARFGRIANPTVHRALRQTQKLVNALIRKFGTPSQIVVEVARDLKLGEEQRKEHQTKNERNRKANDTRRVEIEKEGREVTADSLLRLRLYEDQARARDGVALCPYSGKVIEREQLFTGEVEIDHILPYSRTFDDSAANKVLCLRSSNRDKGKRSPFEWLRSRHDWPDIEARAQLLPQNKRWRFGEAAMERFEQKERDFAERQLVETRYISRLARAYLAVVAGKGNVYVTTGLMTAMLRRRWRLTTILGEDNLPEADRPKRKNRDDHRHHAIDAIVVGAIDRPLLNEMSRRAGEFEGEGRDWRITDAAPQEPFPGYTEAAKRLVQDIVVSRKPEHGKEGKLHDETAYGIVDDKSEMEVIGQLVTRKPLIGLSAGEVDRIRDAPLRAEVQAVVAPFRGADGRITDKKGFEAALRAFGAERDKTGRMQGVRRVRIGKVQKEFVPIRNRKTGKVYKALISGENHHVDIVQMKDGTWRGFPASRFEVNQQGWRPEWERDKLGGKLVMRVHKGDVIAVEYNERTRYMSVHQLDAPNNRFLLAEHFEANVAKRNKDKTFKFEQGNFRKLKVRKARLVHVDILGQVHMRRSNVD